MSTLANRDDPDEMQHNAAFHQGLHSLLSQKKSPDFEMQFYLEVIICVPSIYTNDRGIPTCTQICMCVRLGTVSIGI